MINNASFGNEKQLNDSKISGGLFENTWVANMSFELNGKSSEWITGMIGIEGEIYLSSAIRIQMI